MTRFVLEATERLEAEVFTLASPYRVVIDLPEVSWRLPDGVGKTGAGLIENFRYGLFAPGKSRVVLDVKAPVAVKKSFILAPNGGYRYRLVLDLERVSRKAFFERVEAGRRSRKVAALPVPSPLPARPKDRRDSKRVIVIDPGHGGVDPGTIGRRGTREKTITLIMARELRRRLEATGRYRVVLTRQRDIFVRLRHRVAKARAAGAELFISMHADAIRNRRVRGASVYTLSEVASDKEAAALAAKENKADLIAGVDLTNENPEVTNILIDLAQRESMNYSARFAALLVAELRRAGKILRKSHRFAGFAVLKAPDVPSVLVELGYLSNRYDERLLRQRAYRAKLSDAILRATDKYFASRKN
ncbi:MAG: N-acetylmuramoyl-L-alanine amidase [Alphaproteobacteria bacterium]